jgi:hypothetical protein
MLSAIWSPHRELKIRKRFKDGIERRRIDSRLKNPSLTQASMDFKLYLFHYGLHIVIHSFYIYLVEHYLLLKCWANIFFFLAELHNTNDFKCGSIICWILKKNVYKKYISLAREKLKSHIMEAKHVLLTKSHFREIKFAMNFKNLILTLIRM